jgi:hypothetical protein
VLVADADPPFAEEMGTVLGRDPLLEVVAVAKSAREEESRARADIHAAAFLRREPTAEQTLKGFLEVAVFAVAAQASREDADA